MAEASSVVTGIEADISYERTHGNASEGGTGSRLARHRARTIRYPCLLTNLLPSATDGVAFGGVGLSGAFNPGVNCAATACGGGSVSAINAGRTVDAGLKYAWSNQLSPKAEYLFVDLGSL